MVAKKTTWWRKKIFHFIQCEADNTVLLCVAGLCLWQSPSITLQRTNSISALYCIFSAFSYMNGLLCLNGLSEPWDLKIWKKKKKCGDGVGKGKMNVKNMLKYGHPNSPAEDMKTWWRKGRGDDEEERQRRQQLKAKKRKSRGRRGRADRQRIWSSCYTLTKGFSVLPTFLHQCLATMMLLYVAAMAEKGRKLTLYILYSLLRGEYKRHESYVVKKGRRALLSLFF